MIVDTSALVAILFAEPDADQFLDIIWRYEHRRMSVANYLEATIVVARRIGTDAVRNLEELIEDSQVELEPVTLEQTFAAISAWRRFGRGNHRASLNFGDCFAYALSDVTGEPLLFKGDDFSRTDVRRV